jgi:hypothetical protein
MFRAGRVNASNQKFGQRRPCGQQKAARARFILYSREGEMKCFRRLALAGSSLAVLGVWLPVDAVAQEAADPVAAIQAGAPIIELRARYEGVEQTGRPDDAEALTLRSRIGWQTAKWSGLQALVEFEDVRSLADDRYDSTLNGRSTFAQVFDPEVTELNRAQLIWTPSKDHTVTLGRQRINLDDQRFVGGVAWRQDEQTFDAVRIDAGFGSLKTTYAYIAHVNRIFAEAQDWDSDSHLLNARYTFSDQLTLAGFAYALDFTNSGATAINNQSNLTVGLKASGALEFGSWRLDYAATAARQRDYGSSLLDYSLDYRLAELGAKVGEFTGRAGYEQFEGNGTRGFATPLGTLHAFNGWSDAFVSNGVKTTVDGLTDLNLSVGWTPAWSWETVSNVSFLVRYHEFETERTGVDLGSEWNVSVQGALAPKMNWIVKYADFDGAGIPPAPAGRTKVWFGIEFKL